MLLQIGKQERLLSHPLAGALGRSWAVLLRAGEPVCWLKIVWVYA
jgi:hypothetical protein